MGMNIVKVLLERNGDLMISEARKPEPSVDS